MSEHVRHTEANLTNISLFRMFNMNIQNICNTSKNVMPLFRKLKKYSLVYSISLHNCLDK